MTTDNHLLCTPRLKHGALASPDAGLSLLPFQAAPGTFPRLPS